MRLLLVPFLRLSSVFALGIPLMILANIILARGLPAADYGRYSLFLSVAAIMAVPAVNGFPLLMMREVAAYVHERKAAGYRGLMRSATIWTGVYTALLMAGALVYVIVRQGGTFAAPVVAALLVPLMSFEAISRGALQGFGKAPAASLPIQVIKPTLLILGFALLAWLGRLSTNVALAWYFVVSIFVQIGLLAMLRRARPSWLGGAFADYSDRGAGWPPSSRS